MSHSFNFGSSDKVGSIAGSGKSRRLGDTIRYTSCGYHCFRTCILKVRVRDGMIVACEPDDTVNPGIPREDGYLPEEIINGGLIQARPCARGYAQAQMIYDPNRVKHPMKRAGKRGEGKFERISWDEALDTIAEKLVEVKKNYGPFSLFHNPYSVLGNCSFQLASWFGAGVAGWASYSFNGWDEPIAWVLGKNMIDLTLPQDEVQVFNSRLIVLWGLNPLVTMGGGWVHNLLRAKERGIPIICIEPRYTPSVEVLADQWIPIRPTTDVAMMIAMANVWFKEGLCDKEFVERWIEPEGLRRWRGYVLGVDDGVNKTPQWAEEICGVPAETIREFARLYARSKPVNLNVSLSIGRQFYGENSTRASMYLQALTGNTCIQGGTAAAETGVWLGHPAWGDRPVVDWQRKPGTYSPPVLLAGYKWAKAIDMREKLDKGEISEDAYNNMIGNAVGNPPPNIQMVIIDGSNNLNSLPDVNSAIRAMKKVDFVVVSSQYAELLTARYADILLPQIYMAFEGRDCWSFFEQDLFRSGKSLTNSFIYNQKCVDPVGEVKTHAWSWTPASSPAGRN